MLAVLVTNIKGGCGKTTIATNLATAFAAAGLRTALAEVDRQKSAKEWLANRPNSASAILSLDWRKSAGDAPEDLHRLVIDAPAAMALRHVDELLRRADVVLVPLLPSAFDMRSTGRFLAKLVELKPIRKSRAGLAVVVNRVRSRARVMRSLDEFVGNLDYPVLARLSDRAIYADLAARGLGLFDAAAGSGAALREEWAPLLRALEDAA